MMQYDVSRIYFRLFWRLWVSATGIRLIDIFVLCAQWLQDWL